MIKPNNPEITDYDDRNCTDWVSSRVARLMGVNTIEITIDYPADDDNKVHQDGRAETDKSFKTAMLDNGARQA